MNEHVLKVYSSTIKEQLRVSAYEIKWCLFIALLARVWMGIAPELYRLIPARATECMDWMYLQFNHNWQKLRRHCHLVRHTQCGQASELSEPCLWASSSSKNLPHSGGCSS